MTSAAPTVVALQTNSAWIMILAVSLVTLPAALLLRRVISRPGGIFSSLLLALPLLLPIVAATLYQSGVLPEISVLQPWGQGLLERSGSLLRLVRMRDGSGMSTVYALTGSPGVWIIVIGAGVSSFMLVRRAVGVALVRRLVRKCRPLNDPHIEDLVAVLSARAGMRTVPQTLVLPEGVSGAFATGVNPGKILLSRDLLADLEPDELEGVLAHEVAHLEARDVAVLCTAGFLRDLVAWNVFAHVAFRKLYVDRECEADRRAAALTGAPLSVASGLLKTLDAVKRRGGIAQRAVLGAVRPGILISHRVNGLLSVADGRAGVTYAGRLPFVVAGVLVALLGLQVGSRLGGAEGGLAIVWGERTGEGEIWTVPKRAEAARAKKLNGKLTRSVRMLALSEGVRIHEADVPMWMKIVGKRVKRSGAPTMTLRWEARRQFHAVPLVPNSLPIGIYHLAPEK